MAAIDPAWLLGDVHNSNLARSDSVRAWSVGVYFLIGYAMAMQSLMLATLLAWHLPVRYLANMPYFHDVRIRTVCYLYPLLLLDFLLTSGAGFSGWLILTSLYFVVLFGLMIGMLCRSSDKVSDSADETGNNEALLQAEDSAENAAEGTREVTASEQFLLKLYREVNPSKATLPEVRRLLSEYRGRTNELLAALSYRYPQSTTLASAQMTEAPGWSRAPAPMGGRQLSLFVGSGVTFLLSFAAIMLLIFIWEVDEYRLVEREGNRPGAPITAVSEFQPQMTAKSIQLMYAWPGMAMDLSLEIYVELLTNHCGERFTQDVAPGDRRKEIYDPWIGLYGINMSDYEPSDFMNYTSVNDWFIRKVRPDARPIDQQPNAVVSPADARLLVYDNVTKAKSLWIKGSEFSMYDLIDRIEVGGDEAYYAQGSIVIARLAPQDYHRFHSPVSGKITAIRYVPGTLWSVGADAARSGNYVFYNQRYVVIIDAGPVLKHVAFVAIGATCVGSVQLVRNNGTNWAVGDAVDRGDQLGLMQFGGSTVILGFKRGAFTPDCDLYTHSTVPVETYVQMGNHIGVQGSDPNHQFCVSP